MFTGIITDVGRIESVEPFGDGARLVIASRYDAAGIAIGASIACGGVCLTAIEVVEHEGGARFTVEASTETLARTTLGSWVPGSPVNLERSLKLGDELGGHMVSGHVDGVAEIVDRQDEEAMTVLRFAPPAELARYIAGKGSVALDGTSLTVNHVDGARFDVLLIRHSLDVTTWGERKTGDRVNLEIDTMARYAARLAEFPR